MSAAKHTPGPWLREGNTVYALMHFGFRKGVEQFKNRFWAGVYKDREVSEEEREANAILIAAAPELLEALQMGYAETMDYIRLNNLGAENNHWLVLARAAIAKATGGQS